MEALKGERRREGRGKKERGWGGVTERDAEKVTERVRVKGRGEGGGDERIEGRKGGGECARDGGR